MIVLRTTKYGDSSLVVHSYTQESGRTSFLLRKVRCPALLHPLSILNYQASAPRKGTMPSLKEFSPRWKLYSIREDISKISMAMFIGELLFRTLLHSEKDEPLFLFLQESVLRLEQMQGSSANFHLWFLDRYAAFLGFPFEADFCADYNPFTPEQRRLLEELHGSSFEEAMQITLTGNRRRALAEAVLSWLEYHSGSRIDLRSINVLHSISSDLVKK